MTPGRVPTWLQVVAVTALTSLALGALVAVLIETLGEGGRTAAEMLRQWGVWSAVSSPVAFVFGAVAFVIARSVWRGRARAPDRPR